MDQASENDHVVYRCARVETAFGWVGLVASDKGLVALEFPLQSRDDITRRLLEVFPGKVEFDDEAFPGLSEELKRYFVGEPVQFSAELDEKLGTPFQRKAWAVVRSIPHGQTMSYGDVARKMGHPGAARAVGSAMRANPVPIVVPCHRVIGSDGKLTGFGGGLDLKRRLLRLEGASVAPS